MRLVDLADGEHARVARISEVAEHEAPQLLHLLDERGIVPGIDVGVGREVGAPGGGSQAGSGEFTDRPGHGVGRSGWRRLRTVRLG